MSRLDRDVEFADNPDPRCACVLLLDTSGSMSGEPIAALNEGLRTFEKDLREDELAGRRVEISIVTFGNGGVQTVQDFVPAAGFEAQTLEAGGETPMGAAIMRALALLRDRKAKYDANGIPRYRPWIFMITDGQPTDEWETAARQVHEEEARGGVAFFAVGVPGANIDRLAQIAVRQPVRVQGFQFREMFLWLSQSQKRVSASKVGEHTDLPPIGWGSV